MIFVSSQEFAGFTGDLLDKFVQLKAKAEAGQAAGVAATKPKPKKQQQQQQQRVAVRDRHSPWEGPLVLVAWLIW
jgi:hypothetical protein